MPDQIYKYFPNLSEKKRLQLETLGPLYNEWNQKINVISRKDMDNFYEHHVLHSLAIAKVITFSPDSSILDIGTGGGFPGLPLAILFPDVNFVLVDSVGKKLNVINAIASDIGILNITTVHDRAENISGKFDFITSRAVAKLDVAWQWISNNISPINNNSRPNGLLYLKGGDITEELPNGVNVMRWELSELFDETYFTEKALVLLSPKSNNGG